MANKCRSTQHITHSTSHCGPTQHVTRVHVACHMGPHSMSHESTQHVTRVHVACHTNLRSMSHGSTQHITRVYVACHTGPCSTSHQMLQNDDNENSVTPRSVSICCHHAYIVHTQYSNSLHKFLKIFLNILKVMNINIKTNVSSYHKSREFLITGTIHRFPQRLFFISYSIVKIIV